MRSRLALVRIGGSYLSTFARYPDVAHGDRYVLWYPSPAFYVFRALPLNGSLTAEKALRLRFA